MVFHRNMTGKIQRDHYYLFAFEGGEKRIAKQMSGTTLPKTVFAIRRLYLIEKNTS